MNSDDKRLADILKEQLALVALVVLLSGTVYADAYYSQFGIKLSSLGFQSSYIVYRGFSVVLDHPSIAVPYFVSLAWFAFDEMNLRRQSAFIRFRTLAAYIMVVMVLVSSYYLAYRAGVSRSIQDMHKETSTLAKIKNSRPPIDGCAADECRVLLSDSESVYILKPSPENEKSTVPNTRILARKDYDEIVINIQ